jgi:hypothetical protein
MGVWHEPDQTSENYRGREPPSLIFPDSPGVRTLASPGLKDPRMLEWVQGTCSTSGYPQLANSIMGHPPTLLDPSCRTKAPMYVAGPFPLIFDCGGFERELGTDAQFFCFPHA